MWRKLETPSIDDMVEFGLAIEYGQEPGVASLTAWAADGDCVTLTWDEIAASATVRWLHGTDERLVAERETVSKISVRKETEGLQFLIWSRSADLKGQLVIHVAHCVIVRDSLLRT